MKWELFKSAAIIQKFLSPLRNCPFRRKIIPQSSKILYHLMKEFCANIYSNSNYEYFNIQNPFPDHWYIASTTCSTERLKIYEAEGRWKEKTYGKEIVNSVITMCCNTIYLSQIKSPQTFITRENSNLL